jgi:hypothetical protein
MIARVKPRLIIQGEFFRFESLTRYEHWDIAYGYQNRDIPSAFFIKELNILIINGVTCEPEPSIRISGPGSGRMQISGVGYMGFVGDSNIEKTPDMLKGFGTVYHFLHTSPRIYFSHNQTFKTFYIVRTGWRTYGLQVDGKVFRADGQIPLAIIIEEGGDVVEVKSFEKTFGVTLESFLRRQTPLQYVEANDS